MLKRMLSPKHRKDSNKPTLENLSLAFAAALPESLNWQWDSRFETVLLHIDSLQQEKVIQVLENYFSDYWNILCEEELPENVQELIVHFDGFNPEQLLFSTDTRQSDFVYCAWWPWKDGKNISIRIAPYLGNMPAAEKAKKIGQIKKWFGIKN